MKKRYLAGALAAATVGAAIMLLAPDAGGGDASSGYGQPVDRDLDAIQRHLARVGDRASLDVPANGWR
ncbi:MAG: hypothetical protein IPN38_18035 [Flavobacteriales bacterium]|nr:hypothetical protein [Flavobacteriales bacterium]